MRPGKVEYAIARLGSLYFAVSASTPPRDSAIPVTMSMRTVSLGCSTTVWRMQTIGSRTGPAL